MKLVRLTFLALLAFMISCDEDPKEEGFTTGNVYLSKAKPQVGDSLTIRYTPQDTEETPQGIMHILVNTYSYPQDIALTKKDEAYVGRVFIPDSATAMALNFKQLDDYDTNDDQGYVFTLYSPSGEIVPGSAASTSYFRGSNGSRYGIKYSTDSAVATIRREYEKLGEDIDPGYINYVRGSDRDLALEMSTSYINKLRAQDNLTDQEYRNLYYLFDAQKNNQAADSIKQLALTQYPKGFLAKSDYFAQLREAKTLEEKRAVVDAYDSTIAAPGRDRDQLYYTLGYAYYNESDFENFDFYGNQIEDASMRANMYNNIAWGEAEKDQNLDFAARLSKESLNLVSASLENLDRKPVYQTQSQYKEQWEYNQRMFSDTYAYILFKQGNLDEATTYQEIALGDGKDPEFNERYLQYLVADESYSKAVQNGEQFIKENAITDTGKAYFKEAYTALNKESRNYDNYLAQLEEEARTNAFEDLKNEMIDEEAPQFTLTNLEGDPVALNDLAGKTVVIDFWATWCGPCIKSFPGMQKAVTKYKNNPDVAFLFIDTWENGTDEKRMENVTQFIANNNYSFNVLLDTRETPSQNSYQVVQDFEVEGIPTKFIIGPDGRIKFKSIGFAGSTDQLAQEIDMMIELASS